MGGMQAFAYDMFISHASEDKDQFVRPLATALRDLGLRVWYDEWELVVGDPLIDKINTGLSQSRFGVVILSPSFFKKNWSRAELQALASLEINGSRDLLLPVWLDVGMDEVAKEAPLLLGRLALLASQGIGTISEKLAARVRTDSRPEVVEQEPPPELYPESLQAQALPNTYASPIGPQESGLVFRSILSLSLNVDGGRHLTSQQKRAFQAISGQSAIDTLVSSLSGDSVGPQPSVWRQVRPSSSTITSVARPASPLVSCEGTIEARSGLSLRVHRFDPAYAIVHADVVIRPPARVSGNSLLDLETFYNLLVVLGESLRTEIGPVVGATLGDTDDARLTAQTVVVTPSSSEFSAYIDLSTWAPERAEDAWGPHGIHWNARSAGEFSTPSAWRRTAVDLIHRLFSDGGFLDYEAAVDQLLELGTR